MGKKSEAERVFSLREERKEGMSAGSIINPEMIEETRDDDGD